MHEALCLRDVSQLQLHNMNRIRVKNCYHLWKAKNNLQKNFFCVVCHCVEQGLSQTELSFCS